MAAAKIKWRRDVALMILVSILCTIPMILISLQQPITAIWLTYTYQFPTDLAAVENMSDSELIDLKRSIQKHFAAENIYLAQTDMIKSDWNLSSKEPTSRGDTHLEVWVPLRMKFPLIGDRVLEWRWKLKTPT